MDFKNALLLALIMAPAVIPPLLTIATAKSNCRARLPDGGECPNKATHYYWRCPHHIKPKSIRERIGDPEHKRTPRNFLENASINAVATVYVGVTFALFEPKSLIADKVEPQIDLLREIVNEGGTTEAARVQAEKALQSILDTTETSELIESRSPEDLLVIAQVHAELGDNASARNVIDALRSRDLRSSEIAVSAAEILVLMGDHAEARKWLDDTTEIEAQDPRAAWARAHSILGPMIGARAENDETVPAPALDSELPTAIENLELLRSAGDAVTTELQVEKEVVDLFYAQALNRAGLHAEAAAALGGRDRFAAEVPGMTVEDVLGLRANILFAHAFVNSIDNSPLFVAQEALEDRMEQCAPSLQTEFQWAQVMAELLDREAIDESVRQDVLAVIRSWRMRFSGTDGTPDSTILEGLWLVADPAETLEAADAMLTQRLPRSESGRARSIRANSLRRLDRSDEALTEWRALHDEGYSIGLFGEDFGDELLVQCLEGTAHETVGIYSELLEHHSNQQTLAPSREALLRYRLSAARCMLWRETNNFEALEAAMEDIELAISLSPEEPTYPPVAQDIRDLIESLQADQER